MLGQPKVVVVTVELRVVSGASDELIHSLQFQVTAGEEIVESDGRHIQETVCVQSIAVEEVIAGCRLQFIGNEITALHIPS